MSANKSILDLGRQKTFTPKPALFIALALAVMIGLMFLHLWTRARTNSKAIQVLPPTAQFAISEMTVVNQGKVTVYMPPDATDRAGRITIAPREPDLFVNAEEGEWVHSDIVNVEFVNREGAVLRNASFFLPLEVCYTLTEEEWQAFVDNPGLYQVHHYLEHETPPRWESLLQITRPEQLQLCGQTYDLSAFSLAIRVQVPVTGGDTPTAILNRTLVPTRTPMPGSNIRERRQLDPTAAASTWTPVPTNVPPTSAPPTFAPPTNVPPTFAPPTLQPTLRPTNTPTVRPPNTRVPPTHTPRPPTNTPTPRPPTNTPTPRPPNTPTNIPPTATPPPTDVPPPTATPVPPTDVPPEPTATDVPPEPTATEPPEEPTPTEPAILPGDSSLLDLIEWWLEPSG